MPIRFLGTSLTLLLTLPVLAADTSLHRPIADTYIQAGGEATRSHGTCTALEVDGSPAQITYMTFDLRDLANRVGHATLTLRCLDAGDGGTVYVLDATSWIEGNRCGKSGTGLTFADVDC